MGEEVAASHQALSGSSLLGGQVSQLQPRPSGQAKMNSASSLRWGNQGGEGGSGGQSQGMWIESHWQDSGGGRLGEGTPRWACVVWWAEGNLNKRTSLPVWCPESSERGFQSLVSGPGGVSVFHGIDVC